MGSSDNLTTKLTLVYKVPKAEEPMVQEFEMQYDQLALVGQRLAYSPTFPPGPITVQSERLVSVDIHKGWRCRVTIEVESEVADMEKQDGVWCEKEDQGG